MIKKLKISLLVLLGLISCKHQDNDSKTLNIKQDDSTKVNYLLKNEGKVASLSLLNLKGKWELKKSSNTSAENPEINNFELLNSEFILGDGNCDTYFEIDSIHNLEYYVEGHFYNHTLQDEMKILDKKIYDLFKIKLNTFRGTITTKCSPPFNKIYVFGDNLVVWYSGNYMQFVKKSQKQEKLLFKCKENNNGRSRYDDPLNKTCECNESTFNTAYEIFYNEAPDYLKKDLLEKLPKKNYKHESNDAEVTYNWILNDTLKIDMIFQGGENHYVFYKKSNDKIEYKEYLFLP